MYIGELMSEASTSVSEFMVADTKCIPTSEVCMSAVLMFVKRGVKCMPARGCYHNQLHTVHRTFAKAGQLLSPVQTHVNNYL
jgi:hypothetical protein